jgi:hypothetical protein
MKFARATLMALKRSEPCSWAAERVLIELSKTMDLEAIVKKTGRKPESIIKTAKRLGLFDQGTEGEEGCRKVSLFTKHVRTTHSSKV